MLSIVAAAFPAGAAAEAPPSSGGGDGSGWVAARLRIPAYEEASVEVETLGVEGMLQYGIQIRSYEGAVLYSSMDWVPNGGSLGAVVSTPITGTIDARSDILVDEIGYGWQEIIFEEVAHERQYLVIIWNAADAASWSYQVHGSGLLGLEEGRTFYVGPEAFSNGAAVDAILSVHAHHDGTAAIELDAPLLGSTVAVATLDGVACPCTFNALAAGAHTLVADTFHVGEGPAIGGIAGLRLPP